MPQYYEPAPRFTHGQPLSASGHLNALQDCLQSCIDDALGPQMPFTGVPTAGFDGYVRHKRDLFYYKILVSSGTATLAYNGTTLATLGTGTYEATVSIAGLGLTVDQFYPVTLTGNARAWRLCETETPAPPALTTFADETVPTAAQWQTLSDYADYLATELNHPYVPYPRMRFRRESPQMFGSIFHQAALLVVAGIFERPGHREADTDHEPFAYIVLWINGVETASWALNKHGSGPTRAFDDTLEDGTLVRRWETWNGGDQSPQELIDLDVYGPKPAYGQAYTFEVTYSCDGEGTFWGIQSFSIWELTRGDAALPGAVAMPSWTHGAYAYGSTTALKVQSITANLVTLQARVRYYNYPCQKVLWPTNWHFTMMRRWRFLHYLAVADAAGNYDAKIAYAVDDELHETALPAPPSAGVWMVHDLEGDQYAYPGTVYLLAGIDYAIEDTVP